MTEALDGGLAGRDGWPRARPRLVMVVDNRVVGDSRVEKSAASAVRAGYETYVVGRAFSSLREDSEYAGARLIRVPVLLDRAVYVRNRPRRGITAAFSYRHQGDYEQALRMKRARAVVQNARIRKLETSLRHSAGPPRLRLRAQLATHRILAMLKSGVFVLRKRQFQRAVQKAQQPTGLYYDTRARLWRRIAPGSLWRAREPLHLDYELAYGPVLDELEPDIIHAHDFRAIGIAVRAKWRAEAGGRRVGVVYDAHEHVPGLVRDREFALSNDAQVAEYIGHVDAVVTVSDRLAEVLKKHYQLSSAPRVVMNTPLAQPGPEIWPVPSIRERIGLADDVPLIVHSGSTAPERGLALVVRALPKIPKLHFVINTNARNRLVSDYLELAEQLGVADRVHVARFVPHPQVSTYLSSATLACIPVNSKAMNNNVAAPTKFYEYLHARLPVVVSDARIISKNVRQLGVGEIFQYDKPKTIVDAITTVLRDLPMYQRNVVAADAARLEYSWERQARVYKQVWHDLNPTPLRPKAPRERPPVTGLLIGRVNTAGQGSMWARALKDAYPGVRAEAFAVEKDVGFRHDSEILVSRADFRRPQWQAEFLTLAQQRYSHVLVESTHSLFPRLGVGIEGGLSLLERNQLRVGIVFHGSDLRDPELHERFNPNSPFPRLREAGYGAFVEQLSVIARERRDAAEWFGDPIFVSTPDLLDFVSRAHWLPVSIDVDLWATSSLPLSGDRLVVLHAPSNELLKGSGFIDDVLTNLSAKGLIEYRRVQGVPSQEMPALMGAADVVVDQLDMGLYGVLACEAMAAGRLVVSEVGDRIRRRVPVEIPIVEGDRASLEERIREIAGNRHRFLAIAESGPDFVRRFHDGRYSARVLGRWLGVASTEDIELLEKEALCHI